MGEYEANTGFMPKKWSILKEEDNHIRGGVTRWYHFSRRDYIACIGGGYIRIVTEAGIMTTRRYMRG